MSNIFKHKIKLHNLMFIYLITTVIVTVVSLSKYVTTVSRTNVAKVATMATNVSVDMSIPKDAYPGYEIVYPIVLTNKEGDRICEVSQKYTINISQEDIINIPLEFNLYEDEYCTKKIEKDENGNYSSDEFIFGTESEETKTFYLKIVWPEKYNEEYYAFEIGYFSINIKAEQID